MTTTLNNVAARNRIPRLPLWTLGYFGVIVLANMMLLWFEPIFLAGSAIPPAIFASGFVFVLRDFAQREIDHFVLVAILAAAGATFWLAGPEVALASSSAFLIAELADWVIYSVTKRPMADRVLISSLISVPLDTAVFYALLGILDPLALALGVIIKLMGTMAFWIVLRCKDESKTSKGPAVGIQPASKSPKSGADLGSVKLDFLVNTAMDYAVLSVEKSGEEYFVSVLATGEDATIAISEYARDLQAADGDLVLGDL